MNPATPSDDVTWAAAQPRRFASFGDAYRTALEEELSGAAFFAACARTRQDPRHADKLRLLEAVEVKTAEALQPGARELGLTLRDAATLQGEGVADAAPLAGLPWAAMMDRMVTGYPAYVAEFAALLAASPAALRPVVALLHDHEVAIIDFARDEAQGGDGTAHLVHYLNRADAVLHRLQGGV